MLCKWGMEKAKESEQPVTLFASRKNRELCWPLGFESLGQVNVQVNGEKKKLSFAAMVYRFPPVAGVEGPKPSVSQSRRSKSTLLVNLG